MNNCSLAIVVLVKISCWIILTIELGVLKSTFVLKQPERNNNREKTNRIFFILNLPLVFRTVLHIQDFRDVLDGDGLAGKKHGANHFQGLVLGPLRGDASGQFVSAFDDEFAHRIQIYGFSLIEKAYLCTRSLLVC